MYPPFDFEDDLRKRRRANSTIAGVDFTGSSVDPALSGLDLESDLQAMRGAPAAGRQRSPTRLGRAWDTATDYANTSLMGLPGDLGQQFTRDVDAGPQRERDAKAMRGEALGPLDYLKSGLAGAGGAFLDLLRGQTTPIGALMNLPTFRPAKDVYRVAGEPALESLPKALPFAKKAFNAVQRGAGLMFGAEGAAEALDSDNSTASRVMGGANALMGGAQAFARGGTHDTIVDVDETGPGRALARQQETRQRQTGQRNSGQAPPPDAPRPSIYDDIEPPPVQDGELLPPYALPAGRETRALRPGAERLLPGNVNVRYAEPSSIDPVGYLTGDVPRGTPLGPSSLEEPLRSGRLLRGRIGDDFVRQHGPGVPPTFDELAGVEDVPGGPPLAPEPPYGLRPPRAPKDAFQTPLPDPAGQPDSLQALIDGGMEPPAPRARPGASEGLEGTELGRLLEQAQAEEAGGFEGFFDDPHTDPLTGLAGRRWFDRAGAKPNRLIGRVDLDNFKAVNDELGHAEGDRALQVVSDALRKFAQRRGDIAARLGGDEFGLNLEAPVAGGSVDALRDNIENAIQAALEKAGFGELAGRKIGASLGFGADEAAADAAAMARKAERGVSRPRPAPDTPAWVDEKAWADDPDFEQVLERAKSEGYTGKDLTLWNRYLDHAQSIEGLNADLADKSSGISPQTFLQEIAKAGGLKMDPRDPYIGELRALLENADTDHFFVKGQKRRGALGKPHNRSGPLTIGGVRGVLHPKGDQGKALDGIIEYLSEDRGQRFSHIQSISDLLEAIENAQHEIRTGGRGTRPLTKPPLEGEWWKRIDDVIGQEEAAAPAPEPKSIEEMFAEPAAEPGPAGVHAAAVDSLEPDPSNPAYARVPFEVADDATAAAIAAGADYGNPTLERVPIDDLIATQPTVTRDVVGSKLEAPRPELTELPSTAYGAPRADGPIVYRTPDGRMYLGGGTHETVARKLAGESDVQAIVYPTKGAGPAANFADILDTGEAQPRLQGAENARQAGRADVSFKAPQQATGDDFNLENLLGDGVAERLDRQQNPALFDAGDDLESVISDRGRPAPQMPDATGLPTGASEAARPGLPRNVHDYLTRQLGYSKADVAAMPVEEATRIGRERIKAPAAAPVPAAPEPPSGVVGPDRPTTRLGKDLRAQERRTALQRTRVQPGGTPTRVPGAPEPTTPAQKLARGQSLTIKELRTAGLNADAIADKVRPTLREMGLAPRQLEARAQRMSEFLEDPTPDNFERWVKETLGQAERTNAKDFKAGRPDALPPKHANGEFLGSGFGAFQSLREKNPAAFRVLMQSAAGSLAGALVDDDDPLRGGMYGALIGAGLTPSGARLLRQQFTRLASNSGVGKNVGVRALRAERNLSKDISWAEVLLPASPERVVPDIFKKANDTLNELQEVWKNKPGAVAAKAEKLYMRDVIADIREAAQEAADAGLKRRSWYANKLADSLGKRPTIGQNAIKKGADLAGLKHTVRDAAGKKIGETPWSGKEFEQHVGANIYRVLTGYALDTALQNLSQPIFTLAHVPPSFLKRGYELARTAAGKADTAHLELKRPTDVADDVVGELRGRKPEPGQEKGVKGFLKDPQRFLRKSDTFNRRVSYLAAREYSLSTGATAKAADEFALGVMRKTQGSTGPLGNHPLYRGPVMGSLKPFTKFPTTVLEHAIDVFNQPDSQGRNRMVLTMLGLAAANYAASKATGGQTPDIWEMLVSGGRPLGLSPAHPLRSLRRIASVKQSPFPAVRAGGDIVSHALGTNDHSILEDAPQAIASRFPVKLAEELEHYFTNIVEGEPFAPHNARTASGAADPHTFMESLENLAGLKSNRQIEQRDLMNDVYERRDQLEKDATESRRAARQKFINAVDSGDLEEALRQQRVLGSRSTRELLKGKDKTRFERLLQNAPKKIRQQLESEFGERAQGVRVK